MKTIVVVGNPKPASRTAEAGRLLARAITSTEPDKLVDLVDVGPRLLGWGDPEVAGLVQEVASADLLIVASPTFKATYSGLLKLFLDQLDTGTGLRGVVAVPLMLGAAPHHCLAPELLLKPVLVELGATCPTQGLYQLDSEYQDMSTHSRWLETWSPSIHRAIPALTERTDQ